MNRRYWRRLLMYSLLVVMISSLINLNLNQIQGQAPKNELYDDFNTLDPVVWNVYEFGSPNFSYSVGSWHSELGGGSWVYVANMSTGGSDPAYNGYHIVHNFTEPLDGAFSVYAMIGWSASSVASASQTALRLLNATDDPLGDQGWTIQAQCRDYWVGGPCRQVFHIGTVQYEGFYLPLTGFSVIRIERNETHHVSIYWDNTLFLTGLNNDTITRICLRIVGRHDYPGASGGFSYVRVQLPPLPSDPRPIVPEWFPDVIGLAVIIIGLQLIILIHLIRRRHSKRMAK